MDTQLQAAQQSAEQTVQEGIYADVPESEAEQTADRDFSDGAPHSAKPSGEDKPWKNQENAKNAQRRREREQYRRELKKAREDGIIEALGGKNPYTGEAVKDSRDIDEYLTMLSIEKNGGDPLADFAKYHKQQQKRADADAEEAARQEAWIENDREAFISKYPDVKLNELVEDPDFAAFADGKVGGRPLADIYEGYMRFIKSYEGQARERAARLYANRRASPGALSGADTGDNAYFTPSQVRKMTPSQVHENYEKIKASMQRWR